MLLTVKSEFRVANAYPYNRTSPLRWILSHWARYWWLVLALTVCFAIGYSAFSYPRILFAQAVDEISTPDGGQRILWLALTIGGLLLLDGTVAITGSFLTEILAKRVERDAREELYSSLLGKDLTFHNRQRLGDIMARATDDTQMLGTMVSPGLIFIIADMVLGFSVPTIMIGILEPRLLVIPVIFFLSYVVLVRIYIRRLQPVVVAQRMQYGTMTASIEESISGIELVKAASQQMFERFKFRREARKFRDLFVQQGQIEAFYFPLLSYGIASAFFFLHCVMLYRNPAAGFTTGDFIAGLSLFGILRFPTFISLFSVSLMQLGLASAGRILETINTETHLDENTGGHLGEIKGEVIFENVSFAYEDGNPVLANLNFTVKPGQTIAIVGQTGSGKSTLTQLVNRTFDATSGRVLIDGVDVREWNLDTLRSQISKIEQDVFLFSRTIADNIAFGSPNATQAQIEYAAKEAQAHHFIMSFHEGYQTKIGERGVTLSGGQRQRIALARAFLSNPRILILDDSTSAVDSATEDEIQRAIRRAQTGRTTLLITHRLSQIRWADVILVVEKGQIIAQGDHESLLRQSDAYRRIFSRYMTELPPLELVGAAAD